MTSLATRGVGGVFANSDSLLTEQIEMEVDATAKGVERYRRLAYDAVDRGDGASLKPAERLLVHWYDPLVTAVRDELRLIMSGKPGAGRAIYGPVMLQLDSERMAVIAMHELLSRCMGEYNGTLLVQASYAIGNAVIAEIHHDEMRRNHKAELEDLDRRFKRITASRVNCWAKKTLADPKWSRKVCVHLGTRLIDLVIGIATVKGYQDEWTPAFEHKKVWREGQKKGVVKLSDEADKVLESGHIYRQHLRPRFQPMICEPWPWSADQGHGGYLQLRPPLVSKPRAEQTRAIKNANMDVVYEAVNALNATAWQINPMILDAMEKLWVTGGGDVLPSADPIPLPAKPADIDSSQESLKAWKAEAHEVHGENAKLRGARAEFMQKLALAREMQGREMYFPHQLCFRSRAYPIPPVLNHHGDDISRGLLMFWTGKRLTEKGLARLKEHCASMYGMDKGDYESRRAWVDDNMELIMRVASDPVNTVDMWSQADEPWQFLAAAMGIVYPELGAFIPVQRDGSQNGNQHYVAAGLDEVAAPLVNVTPGDTPADSYLMVGGRVMAELERQAAGGERIAADLINHCERKVYKQTVMTFVYNVTKVGAREQIKGQLKKRGVDRRNLFKYSALLSGLVLDAVGDTFPKSTQIMRWIETCCRMMCKHSPNRAIQWTTPLGFPVIQPYRSMRKFQIRTCMQRLTIGTPNEESPVALGKQVQGGPPNVVHSWDATHMMCTALECRDQEVEFAAVHDSFWTHAETVDDMDSILRDQFVALHSSDLVYEMYEEWCSAYPGLDLPEPPTRGSLNLDQVRQSRYFFH